MINYNDKYRTVFRSASGDIEDSSSSSSSGTPGEDSSSSSSSGTPGDVLNYIHGIRVDVKGPMCDNMASTAECPSIILTGVSSSKKTGMVCTLDIKVPIIGIDDTYTVSNGVFSDGKVSVSIDFSPIPEGEYEVEASVLLRSLMITPERRIKLFDAAESCSINLKDGINTKVTYSNNTLILTGGPGLGQGMYHGSTDKHTSNQYKGLLSINGVRSARDISIEMSDLLSANGGRVYAEKKPHADPK